MNKWLPLMITALLVTTTSGAPLAIIGVDTSSGVTFEGATVSNVYTLEFATSVNGPWTNWGSVTEQPITGRVMTISSPVFYRIMQTDTAAFPPYAALDHTHSGITSSWLASNAVGNGNLVDGAVTDTKLADGAVTQAKLASGTVGRDHLAGSAVTSDKIADSSITTDKIHDGAVGCTQLANGAIDESKFSVSGVLVANLNADMVDGIHASDLSQPGVVRVVRGTFDLPGYIGTATFSPSVNPIKCMVFLRGITPTGAYGLQAASVLCTALTSNSISFQKCTSTSSVTIEYQIIEYQ